MSGSRVLRSPVVGGQRRLGGSPASPATTPTGPASTPASPALAPVQATSGSPAAMPGFEAGHAEGLRQGLADAQSKLEREIDVRWQAQRLQAEQAEKRRSEEHAQRLAALDNLLQTVQKALPERFLALERAAIELAYEALCRVCGPHAEQQASHDRAGLLADILRQGVYQLRGQPWLGVRLHPRDHAALLASEAGRALLARHPEVRVQADASLEPLAAVIEGDHGQLDVGLATQLTRLKELWAAADQARAAPLIDRGPT